LSALTHFGRISTTAVVVLCLFSSVSAYSGGNGEPNNPYQIGTVGDWQHLMGAPADWNLHFIMTADVNLYGIPLTPVGNSTTKFTGAFDGNDHIFSNAVINQPSNAYVGLFGYLNGGQIKNSGVENANITGGIFVGGLLGFGASGCTISNCYSTGSVSSSSSSSFTGGLVGYLSSGTISNSYSTGFVFSSSSSQGLSTGGLVGYLYSGIISNSYSTGSVSSSSLSSSYTGGLVGYLYSGTISNSYSTGFISSFSSSISIFYPPYAGGLVGALNSGTILNSYSTGSVSSTAPSISAYAGGLVGDLGAGTISNCYSTGFVSSSLPSHIGGLVGYNPSSIVTASFWDTETSGQETSAGGTGLPTADMQNENTFLNAGWDFVGETVNGLNDIWGMYADGAGYPRLSWEKYSGGDGSEAAPYKISNITDFMQLSLTPADCNKSFILTADINLAGYSFTKAIIAPDIDNGSANFEGVPFSGVFDGNDHSILSITIDTNGVDNYFLGLFGQIDANGTVKNLGVEDVNVTTGSGSFYAGGLCGRNKGNITNCHSAGTASGNWSTGGLCGRNEGGSIVNCYSTGNVSGSSETGGLCGINETSSIISSITNCYSTCNVTGSDYSTGGLCGWNGGNVTNCYSAGNVRGSNDTGGLWGVNYDSVTGSYFLNTAGPNNGVGEPLTDAQMKQQVSFTGWDFVGETVNGPNDVWRICESTNYPKLAWQIPLPGDFTCPDGVDIYDLAIFVDQWLLEELSYNIAPAGGDGIVNFLDFAVFANDWQGDMTQLSEFASEWLQSPNVYNADIAPVPDGDGIVNMLDFAAFAENWLAEN
jgi:hypothetical protein